MKISNLLVFKFNKKDKTENRNVRVLKFVGDFEALDLPLMADMAARSKAVSIDIVGVKA